MDNRTSSSLRRRPDRILIESAARQSQSNAITQKTSDSDNGTNPLANLFQALVKNNTVSLPEVIPIYSTHQVMGNLATEALVSLLRHSNIVRNSTSSNVENEANERRLLELRQQFSQSLLSALRQEFVEPGIVSAADQIVSDAIKSNRLAALTWLNELFISNISQPDVASGLLLVTGRIPYKNACPNGPTMAVAGLSHSSAEVQEAAVRAFEHWATPDCLKILENIRTPYAWLSQYIEDVKNDIKQQLCA